MNQREWVYRGRPLQPVEWGIWKDTSRPGYYFICYRPAGRRGSVLRRWFRAVDRKALADLKTHVRGEHAAVEARKVGMPSGYPLSTMKEDYLSDLRRRNRRQNHIVGVECTMRKFIESAAERQAERIDAACVRRFLQKLAKDGAAPRTQNRYRKELLAWFGFGIKQGRITANPVVGTEPATVDELLVEFPPPSVFADLVEAAAGWDAACATFALLTGLRLSSIVGLDETRFGADAITVETKRRKVWYMRYDAGCPLWGPDLRELGLRIWRERIPHPRVLQDHFEKNPVAKLHGLTFKSLRHGLGSYCSLMGEAMGDIAKWLHHSAPSTTERYYVHLAPRGRDRIEENRKLVFIMRSRCMAAAMGGWLPK